MVIWYSDMTRWYEMWLEMDFLNNMLFTHTHTRTRTHCIIHKECWNDHGMWCERLLAQAWEFLFLSFLCHAISCETTVEWAFIFRATIISCSFSFVCYTVLLLYCAFINIYLMGIQGRCGATVLYSFSPQWCTVKEKKWNLRLLLTGLWIDAREKATRKWVSHLQYLATCAHPKNRAPCSPTPMLTQTRAHVLFRHTLRAGSYCQDMGSRHSWRALLTHTS